MWWPTSWATAGASRAVAEEGQPGRKGAFLDRDGVLIVDPGYLGDPEGVVLLPGVAEALRQLRAAGYCIVVITNQSGVGRGYFTESDLAAVHARMAALLLEQGACVDGIYYCPHGPEAACDCRKPAPGLIEQAAAEWGIAVGQSFMAGDQPRDLEAARRAGIPLRFGIGNALPDATHNVETLLDALPFIGVEGR